MFYIGVPVVRKAGWTYGHVTTKIYRMHKLPNFLTYGARARELRYNLAISKSRRPNTNTTISF